MSTGCEHENERVLFAFPKSPKLEVRAVVRPWAGNWLFELREFFKRGDGTWRPTRSGVPVHADQIGELVAAVAALQDAARELSTKPPAGSTDPPPDIPDGIPGVLLR